jgi:hypothetical protein
VKRVKLYQIAHSRAGDKGELTNISLIPYKEDLYEEIKTKVTPEVVKRHFKDIVSGHVIRYDLPKLCAFNFVLEGTRPGGVASALDIDPHGKSLSWALLEIEISIDEELPV